MTVKNNSNNESAVETHGRASLTSDSPSTAELQIRIRELEKEIARLHSQIKEQRYGLTWLDVPEAFETESENKIPILEEVKEKAIDAAGRDALNASANNTPPHIIIEGDNYHALSCLNYTHRGKIDVIYIDPPYNTGNDGFTYKDKRFLKEFPDGSPVPKEHPLRHSYWLSFMSKRLELAKNLLSNRGVIFISIDDNEQANLKLLCDKVFGEENYVATFQRLTTKSGKTPLTFMVSHESLLCYVKNELDIFVGTSFEDDSYKFEDEYVDLRGKFNLKQPLDCNSISYSQSLDYPIEYDNKTYYPGGDYENYKKRKNGFYLQKDYAWRWSKELFDFGLQNGWIVFKNGRIYTKGYLNATIENINGEYQIVYRDKTRKRSTIDFIDNAYSNDIAKKQLLSLNINTKFDYPKPLNFISDLILTHYSKSAVILDFFAGSGTTLHATMKLNAEDGGHRQCILVQQREGDNNICENVTYERNRRVMCGYTNAKGEQVEGLGGRLKYYRTAFVGKHASHNAIDADRVELSRKAGYLLALGENTLEEIAHTDTYQIFADTRRDDVNIVSESNSLASCYTAIYFTENYAKMPEFVAEIDKLRSVGTCNPQINVYIFCWGTPEIFEGEFDDLRGIALKAIPQPILDVYKSINQ